MSNPFKGQQYEMTLDSVDVGEITSIEQSIENNVTETNSFDVGNITRHTPGRATITLSVETYFTGGQDAAQKALIEAGVDGPSQAVVPFTFQKKTPVTGDLNFAGDVLVRSASISASDGEDVTLSFELQVTETFTVTAES